MESKPAARSATSKRARRRSGVSLVEVTIAMGILGFGVLGAAASQIASVKMNMDSQSKTAAYYLAQQRMELFQAMSGAAVAALPEASSADPVNDPGNPIDPDPNDGFPRAFTRSWDIDPGTPEDATEPGVLTITVSVGWTDDMGIARNGQCAEHQDGLMMNQRRKIQGFTLIELMISTALLAVVVSQLMLVFNRAATRIT